MSASRLAAAFKAGPGEAKCWCRNSHLHPFRGPYIVCLTASPANPGCVLRIRKGLLTFGHVSSGAKKTTNAIKRCKIKNPQNYDTCHPVHGVRGVVRRVAGE